MSAIIISLLLIAVIGYLWGSIPSGYWMGKLLRGKDFDIRDYGSKKTGATNVRRTLGNWPALIVLLVDLSKGVGPALLARYVPVFNGAGWGIAIAGLAALIGHCYPIFIGFRGGRGVITGAGAVLVISPLIFLIAAVLAIGTIAISRYVSLGSIVGAFVIIICGIIFRVLGWVSTPEVVYLMLGPAFVVLLHYDNIGRLLTGKERKLGQKEVISDNSPTTQHEGTFSKQGCSRTISPLSHNPTSVYV
ncbi:MAG: glycerol-3-phosphate 1-O-acyltransferase PlsY [Ktedonobacteraceae bacterium]